jgi:predicted DNA-binding ribbon-helix-helix protein
MRRHPHRGVVIAGHPTSLRLEPKFWDFLREIAYERQLSLSELINAINRAKSSKANLASALRVFVAQHYHSAAVLKGKVITAPEDPSRCSHGRANAKVSFAQKRC